MTLIGMTYEQRAEVAEAKIERLEAENAALKAKMLDNWVNKDAYAQGRKDALEEQDKELTIQLT